MPMMKGEEGGAGIQQSSYMCQRVSNPLGQHACESSAEPWRGPLRLLY